MYRLTWPSTSPAAQRSDSSISCGGVGGSVRYAGRPRKEGDGAGRSPRRRACAPAAARLAAGQGQGGGVPRVPVHAVAAGTPALRPPLLPRLRAGCSPAQLRLLSSVQGQVRRVAAQGHPQPDPRRRAVVGVHSKQVSRSSGHQGVQFAGRRRHSRFADGSSVFPFIFAIAQFSMSHSVCQSGLIFIKMHTLFKMSNDISLSISSIHTVIVQLRVCRNSSPSVMCPRRNKEGIPSRIRKVLKRKETVGRKVFESQRRSY